LPYHCFPEASKMISIDVVQETEKFFLCARLIYRLQLSQISLYLQSLITIMKIEYYRLSRLPTLKQTRAKASYPCKVAIPLHRRNGKAKYVEPYKNTKQNESNHHHRRSTRTRNGTQSPRRSHLRQAQQKRRRQVQQWIQENAAHRHQ